MTFVVSAGQVASLERAVTPAITTSIRLSDRRSATYEALWRTQPQIRTVVGFLARNIAQLGLHVFERVSDTDRKRLTDHPLAQLLGRPLPERFKVSRYRLINALVHDLGIYDNAYWLKIKVDGGLGLVRVPPRQVAPSGGTWFAADEYKVSGSRGTKSFPAEQVVHLFGYNPSDPRHGVSPIESLRQILAEDYASGRFREQLWANSARIAGYLKRPAGSSWEDPARQRFTDSWRAQYTGDGPQAGGTPILEDGMDFVKTAMTSDEAQYLETRKLTREEVAAAYYIPPPMVGILDHATFSNITEQHKMLYQDTLGPWLEMIQEDIELQLLPDLNPTGASVYVEFNIGEKLKGSFEEQAASIQTLTGRPVLTADEGRGLLNRNALGGDAARLVTPLNMLLDGQISDGEPESGGAQAGKSIDSPGAKARTGAKARAAASYQTKAQQVLESFFGRQAEAVMTALTAGQDWWDQHRWDTELTAALYGLALEVTKVIGQQTAETLGFGADDYDVDHTLHFLQAVATARATKINATTKDQLTDTLSTEDGDPAAVFTDAKNRRTPSAAISLITAFSGLATVEAARQTIGSNATKTWITGPNPRPSHAVMNGQTVPIGDRFSNGLMWPGEPGEADETAGCNCSISISRPD